MFKSAQDVTSEHSPGPMPCQTEDCGWHEDYQNDLTLFFCFCFCFFGFFFELSVSLEPFVSTLFYPGCTVWQQGLIQAQSIDLTRLRPHSSQQMCLSLIPLCLIHAKGVSAPPFEPISLEKILYLILIFPPSACPNAPLSRWANPHGGFSSPYPSARWGGCLRGTSIFLGGGG
jgi:hypothetical protein